VLALWELLVELACKFVNVGRFCKILHVFLLFNDAYSQMLADFLLHLQQRRKFLFGQHAYLQIKVSPLFGLPGHTVLAYQHENRQEDGFGGNHEGENAKRKRVEWLEARKETEVGKCPRPYEEDMQNQERKAAGKFRDGIACSLGKTSATERVFFQLGDCGDVEFGRMSVCGIFQVGFHDEKKIP
jgi:hypothetical protein